MKKRITSLKPWIFWLVYSGVIVATVLIDQLTKYYIGRAANNVEGWSYKIFPHIDWLYLYWTLNDGATGGIFQGFAGRNILFFVMTIVGLPVFGYMLWRSRTRSVWGQVAFAFMIGGTLGNAIDRLFLAQNGFFTGAVRDFVRVTWFFGIFNMADSFLVVGVFLALLAIVVFDPDSLIMAIITERKEKIFIQAQQIETKSTDDNTENGGADNDMTEAANKKDVLAEKNDEDD